jgi:NitT/TauT family transport system ATP-binding protein
MSDDHEPDSGRMIAEMAGIAADRPEMAQHGMHRGAERLPIATGATPPHVELRGVSLVYGEGDKQLLAVDRLDMSIARGEFVAVVGPSGCGKSTLMKLVTGLLPPDTGCVLVDGQEVRGPLKGVGMAFQNSTLMPWRTTLRNIMLPLEVVAPHKTRLRRDRAAYEAAAEALLATVGLGGFGGKYPWELSGGMQQRASLCRALIHEPPVLMLDEPFGALDAFTREELWATLQALWMQRHFTTVLVTHDLREAVFLADTVYVMSKRPGRVVMRRKVDLPRPRTLADSFRPEFVDIAHDLRNCISETRQ